MNIMIGMISPERNWAPKLASYSCSFSSSKVACDLLLTAEHLDEGMAGERLLDLGVEGPGAAPLVDEPGSGIVS